MSGKQFLILLGGGLVLAVGGCALFLGQVSDAPAGPLGMIGLVVFVVGALMFAIGMLLALVLVIKTVFSR